MSSDFDRRAAMQQEETPRTLYLRIKAETQDSVAAIRAIRTRYGLTLTAAKEIGLQAEGIASSLDAHQAQLVPALLPALEDQCGVEHALTTIRADNPSP